MRDTYLNTITRDFSHRPISTMTVDHIASHTYVLSETMELHRIRKLEEKVAKLEEKLDSLWLAGDVSDLI